MDSGELRITLFGVELTTQKAQDFCHKHAGHKMEIGRSEKEEVLFVRCEKCNELFIMTFEEVRAMRKEQELCQKSM
jgi:hypothetical protein